MSSTMASGAAATLDVRGRSNTADDSSAAIAALDAASHGLAGRVFTTKKEAVVAIKNIALQANHRMRCHDKLRGRTFTVYYCDQPGCTCRIEVSQIRRRDMEGFRIKSVQGIERLCVSDVGLPTCAQVAALLHVRAAVVGNARISASAVQALAQQVKGWRISSKMALRAREEIVKELNTATYNERFRKLHSLLDGFDELDDEVVVAVAAALHAHVLGGRPPPTATSAPQSTFV